MSESRSESTSESMSESSSESDYENDGETSLFGQSLHDWAVELRLLRCHIGSYNDEQTRFLPSRFTPNVVM